MIDKTELRAALLDLLRNDRDLVQQLHHIDDLDSGLKGHHHTLGKLHNQASPGSHIHNGKDSLDILSNYLGYDGAAKRIATAGSSSFTTDVNGEAVITHNFTDMKGNPLTPFVVVATEAISTQSRVVQTSSYTSTTFTIRMWVTSTGARLATVAVTVRWIAIG